jgi:hypothetical protein
MPGIASDAPCAGAVLEATTAGAAVAVEPVAAVPGSWLANGFVTGPGSAGAGASVHVVPPPATQAPESNATARIEAPLVSCRFIADPSFPPPCGRFRRPAKRNQ